MHEIKLKTVEIVEDGKKVPIFYKAQLVSVMRAPTREAADYEELRKSVRILNILDETKGDVLKLEDADFDYMCQKVKTARWPFIDAVILSFIEDVTSGDKK